MAFVGFTEDGEATYDTQEAAIERAKMIREWSKEPMKIFVHRKWVPLWFAHLVQNTRLDFLAYKEVEENQ